MNVRSLASKALAAASALAISAVALADGPPTVPDASSYVTAITTGQSTYGPVMWGLALVAVGVMVGVKWIKRGRGAA